VELNCAAIPGGMAESELFGHERGAFTGADRNRSGRFRAASGGTLFLDEIGDLPLDLQAKLLKAIEDQQVTPVGSDKAQPVDVRLIAATHRNLFTMVEAGTFRRDLYERLKATIIRIPPLRDRPEEIRPLVQRFLAEWNDQYAERRTLTTDALSLLESYPWPGNIRELRNALTSAACAVQGDVLDRDALPEEIRAGGASVGIADGFAGTAGKPVKESPDGVVDATRSPGGINLKAKMLQMEWEYISAALRRHGNNREAAAKDLGMSGPALRKALKERFAAFAEEEGESPDSLTP
jgi:DNA-binding NtrC family response regulator